jgi:hypothetical protein
VIGLQLDVLHVGRTGPDVLGGDVPAAEGLDESAMRPEHHLAVGALVVPHNDRLPPAQIDPRDRRLVGHAARQAERVGDRVVGRAVLPEAGAAERGAQRGIVDGDDPDVPAGGIVRQEHLLVSEGVHLREDVHQPLGYW